MDDTLDSKKCTLIFLSLVISCISATIMSTALTTALPSILTDLSITQSLGQCFTSGYSLVMAIVSPFAGRIFDRLGIKPLLLLRSICLVISTLGMFYISSATPLWLPAFYNVVRSIAIGCLMMPLVTWGTSHIAFQFTADGTALLTSLRTVGGAIGSAVFVSLMSTLATANSLMGQIQGLNRTFLCMTFVAVLLLALGLFFVKGEKGDTNSLS